MAKSTKSTDTESGQIMLILETLSQGIISEKTAGSNA